MKKIINYSTYIFLSLGLLVSQPLKTLASLGDVVKPGLNSFGDAAGYNTGADATADTLVGKIGAMVKILLAFLGVIFLILIIVSGWQWMMAGGDAKKIEAAKQRIINATIGLVIILAAYTITYFVMLKLNEQQLNNLQLTQ